MMRSFMSVLLTKYHASLKITKNYMGGACGTHGEGVHTGFWWGNLKERDHLEDLGTDRRLILEQIFKKMYWVMEWI